MKTKTYNIIGEVIELEWKISYYHGWYKRMKIKVDSTTTIVCTVPKSISAVAVRDRVSMKVGLKKSPTVDGLYTGIRPRNARIVNTCS